ncbi:MAG: DUF1292 domain-containing protein [Ruminococcus sp.]|nr:DUF1292 domain-containing protein [Ruminococcus sp.]
MSEIINENVNIPEDEEENENYITLTDDNGEDVSFEVLGTLEYKERWFAVLLPFDEEDEGVVILELVPSEDPEFDEFVGIDDDALVNEVFEEFKKTYEGPYNFE